MRRLWEGFYTAVFIPLIWLVLRSLGPVNRKVRRGIRGRRSLFAELAARMGAVRPGRRVWFHASSMGEFEQAKPIIAELKRRSPETRIVASFFSPSGYDHSLKYPLADVITYLPFDTLPGVRKFLDLVRPDAAVMVRYDVWPNMIWELERRKVPTLIANATMRPTSARFLPALRNFHHHLYDSISEILTVSERDVEAFQGFGLEKAHVEAIGDTRFDQVCSRSAAARKHHLLPEGVTRGTKVIVIGSSWPEDEEVIIPAFLALRQQVPQVLMVIVPHEPTLEHLEELERRLNGSVETLRFSALNEYRGEPVIIVDSIGILLMLYAAADVAYVGGSFRQGIHNVLEAAVYGVPVLFGPRHKNSQEPGQLVERGGAFVVEGSEDLAAIWRGLLTDEKSRLKAGTIAAEFVSEHTGATERFLEHLQKYLRA
ncbi:MAG TPA: glycosyltransferase N-terminal domain-containing protein [Bacteroidota bacterium]